MEREAINRVRLGLRLRLRRHVMKLTQEQLGQAVGCPARVISAIEHGRCGIPPQLLSALCQALAYPPETLMQDAK